MNKQFAFIVPAAITAICLSGPAFAATANLVDNRVIVDNSPFFSIGGEDELGSGNFGLNHPAFIDIPYAIFSFGGDSSVVSATLSWNFNSLWGGSGPTEISLYAGFDDDGAVTIADRFMGSLIDTFTYTGGEVRSHDVTALVNSALGAGTYFAARLEVSAAPGVLSGYAGGQFLTPTLDYSTGPAPVPLPAGLPLLLAGLGMLGFAKRRRKS